MFRIPIPRSFWENGGDGSKKILPGDYALTYQVPGFVDFDIVEAAFNLFTGTKKTADKAIYTFKGAKFVEADGNTFFELLINVENIDGEGILQGQNNASALAIIRVIGILFGALLVAYSLTKVERIVTEAELAVTLGAGAVFLSYLTPFLKVIK